MDSGGKQHDLISPVRLTDRKGDMTIRSKIAALVTEDIHRDLVLAPYRADGQGG